MVDGQPGVWCFIVASVFVGAEEKSVSTGVTEDFHGFFAQDMAKFGST